MLRAKLIIAFISFSIYHFSYAQNFHSNNLKNLDQLLSAKKFKEADSTLNEHIEDLKGKSSYYLLTDYIYYTGKINLALYNPTTATKAVKQFIGTIESATDSIKVHRQVQLELSSFYELIGDSIKAYDANLNALELTKRWDKATPEDFGLVENNLGTLSNRKGEISKGVSHHKKALKHYESYPNTNKTNLYILYNSLGGTMWYVSKIDSALYFYKKAEKTLALLEQNAVNSFYRPASLKNNIAGIYATQGNLAGALDAMKQTIDYLNKFIKTDVNDAKKEGAIEFLFQAIENYAGIYKDIGDFERAKELLEYVYDAKKKHFDETNTEVYKAKVLLGQIYLSLKDYKRSERFLDEGIKFFNQTDSSNGFWLADAHYSKALLNEELGQTDKAKKNYEEAERLYESALKGAYDELYLDFITHASHFYASSQAKEKALSMSKKAYDYILKNQGPTSSFEIQQALNLGEIHYKLGDYKSALEKAKSTEALLQKRLPTQTNPLDSIKTIFFKPTIILLKTQSAYALNTNKNNVEFFKGQFAEIKEAIALIEQQKTFVTDEKSIALLIEKNADFFEFAKRLALDLYKLTSDNTYIHEAMGLHESILYNRIRSRLKSKTSMSYANVPKTVLDEEQVIKKNIKASLTQGNSIDAFFKANTNWNTYVEKLKKNYPKYYKLRFASISKSLKDFNQNIPESTSIIRYFYANKDLYATVLTNKESTLFKLNATDLSKNIASLQTDSLFLTSNYKALYNLYYNLWKPLENKIKTDHVVIVPDRDLFNLNFEMLTQRLVTNNKELAQNSLLTKYSISYNYSLLLLDKTKKTIGYQKDFVAFAPEFNDKMKADYTLAVTDSISIDKTYLRLLPQPFSVDLAKEYSRLFDGDFFINERASKQIFKNEANEHKIIHIGTHAESNNVSPELSRLIFAKNNNSDEDNSLYTYEIYNQNLNSNLAILTACETGKPTYQAGEGMISLAHAFNYAGSESILTSLWKIDEKSSAKIIELFFINIKNGLPKDEALRQAKLSYIASAEGRTVAPHYWAGLVLIGDVAPIELQTPSSSSPFLWYIFGALFIILAIVFIKKRKTESK